MAQVLKVVKKFVDCVDWVVVDQHPPPQVGMGMKRHHADLG